MTNREPFNHCTRRYYRSKYQSYHRDSVGENKDVGYKLLGWYIKSSTGMLHHRRRYISDKEALYRNVINSLSKNEENELSSIRERIATLFNNQLYSDVVLNINEKKLFGHSFVLSLASPVFKATFYDELNFARKDSFDVLDVTENGFMNLLRFIYMNNTPESDNLSECLETLYAARVFLVSSLVNICIQKCLQVINSENLCQILDTAYCLDLYILTDNCLQLYAMQPERVLTSESFLSAKTDTVLLLFSMAIENGTKKEFNFHLMKWAINEAKRRGLSTFQVATVLKPFFEINSSDS
ncbi:BTB/POZ domain-containing protein 3-like isoform X1 [Centruroides sculpturatus]|uniref:BTB/POZ domain-containing protein 3-like isoform X1 n=2 Tax=Centruroides sculpturatus TaxID=218467 RepID=UPI000C6D5969|nr:BTB/POZ domain-containing protein 3-like isoform X1 [Centruroides sculpturatus]XP_023227136.1 BTB/POZ domain-containing protein 3-like isoform X1 [Centruroides sculpturatus]